MTASAAMLDGEDYITQQLYLGEDLVLHLRGNVPEEYRDGSTATITYAGNTDSYTINDLTPDENGLYDLPVTLAVAQMTEEINLVLKAKMGLIPIEAINETYSIRNYLKTLIDGNYTRETKQLAQELLNYGAWSQKYFNYNTSNLANKGYDINVSYPVPDQIPTVEYEGAVPGITYYGASVRHTSKLAVRHYFETAENISNYTITVNGEAYTPVAKDGRYYIEVTGFNPQDMDTEMTVAVTDGEKTLSFGYAPTDYFIRSYHKATDENLKGMMEAAYSYFMAARNFAGVTDTGKLTFEYKGGTANSIQVNTNLPADIALADFKLNENGCSVNEDANTKKASNVAMSNVDGKIVLTFNFAENFTAGETYSLPKNAFFCFTDNSQFALAQDYLFQFDGTSWTQVEAAGDFLEGVDFENIGNTLLFTGEGPASKAATIERVAHATEITPLSGGGDYALKLTHASSYYPTFRVNFGKELAAGTKISFMAFGIIYGDSQYDHSIFEFNNGGEATVQFTSGEWMQLTMTLPENADHVDLFWNFERANLTNENTTGAVYVDNFLAIEPVEAVGDFMEGVDFETAGNEGLFTGIGGEDAWRDATLTRVPYSFAGVDAPANGGSYALKVSSANKCWPTFRMNFGKTLEAGTTITFDVYGYYEYAAAEGVTKYIKLELTGDSKNYAASEDPNQVLWTVVETWKTGVSITLTADCDHIDFFYNVADGQHGEVPSWLLLDNFKAEEPPLVFTGDFETGVGLEDEGDILQFTGQGAGQDATIERVSYADVNVSAPANGGSYALKVSHASNCWPTFRVNFGKTLEAGTTITFDVYGNYDYAAAEGVTKYIKLELSADSKNYATSEDPNQVLWTVVETWRTGVSITLTADCDHIDFFYNVADGQHGDVSSWLLLDNFKAKAAPLTFTGDFENGVGFEDAGDILQFVGIADNQAATIERVSYADANVSAPANGGSYALKVSHANNCWPNFRINFGQTLKAGTTITFDFYGNYTSDASGKYVKLELTGNSKNYATSADPNQVVWTLVEKWNTATITLTADSDHIDLFYNVADGQHGDSLASWIYLDNIQAVEPILVTEGLNFDNAREAGLFEALSQDVMFEITSVDGNNVLKASHASNCWPNFRINFGQTLKAGTTITFDFYGNYTSDASGKYVKLELTGNSKNYATSADPNQVVWTLVEKWNTATITLTADSDHIDLFYNVADGQHGDSLASWIYLDNIQAVEPILVSEGLNFDDAREAGLFEALTQDMMFEVTSVDGNNVLKASHASNCWPNFRINFGQTLKAGTTITFDFYGNYDYVAPEGGYKYVKLELTGNSKSYATSADPNQIVWTLAENWNTVSITLTADSDHVELFYNVADGQHGDSLASWIYMDNFSVV